MSEPLKHKDADGNQLFLEDRVFVANRFDTAWIITGETNKSVRIVNERFYRESYVPHEGGGWCSHPSRVIKSFNQEAQP